MSACGKRVRCILDDPDGARVRGWRTSSSAEFIQAVAPRWAVVPVGYRNRFGHPSREVLERYRAAGAEILRTDLDGAVLVRLAATGSEVQTERRRRARYWLQ
jgi:competence protein ComEC